MVQTQVQNQTKCRDLSLATPKKVESKKGDPLQIDPHESSKNSWQTTLSSTIERSFFEGETAQCCCGIVDTP